MTGAGVATTIDISVGVIYRSTAELRWNGPVLEQAWQCMQDGSIDWRPVPAASTLPKLDAWQFQPDADNPGLFIQCSTPQERELIMRALGWQQP